MDLEGLALGGRELGTEGGLAALELVLDEVYHLAIGQLVLLEEYCQMIHELLGAHRLKARASSINDLGCSVWGCELCVRSFVGILW